MRIFKIMIMVLGLVLGATGAQAEERREYPPLYIATDPPSLDFVVWCRYDQRTSQGQVSGEWDGCRPGMEDYPGGSLVFKTLRECLLHQADLVTRLTEGVQASAEDIYGCRWTTTRHLVEQYGNPGVVMLARNGIYYDDEKGQ